jgi:Fe-Mn family superoxide dismutase
MHVFSALLIFFSFPTRSLSLEEIIAKAPPGGIFNNAAQVWNHTFFWSCMKPHGGGHPNGPLAGESGLVGLVLRSSQLVHLDAINKKFGNLDNFKAEFTKSALGNFGAGWTWLVRKKDGSVDIVNTSNAGTPATTADKPLLVIDVRGAL